MTTISPSCALRCALRNIVSRPLRWVFAGLLAPIVAAAQCPVTVNAGPDQFACAQPATFTLAGAVTGNYQQLSWAPAAGDSLNPSVTINQTTTYVLTAKTADFGQNLVQNGDFEQGNIGFTSDYPFNGGFAVWPPFGTYDVAPVPVGIMPCRDHGTGLGNFMFADGADQPNLLFWCQTVPVTPNTDYLLSTWATSMNPDIPFAELQFTINGGIVGNMTAPAQCTWAEFTGIWNSGNATTANICIENLNLQLGQNDFGIDDIGFFPMCEVSDTVTLHVVPITATAQATDTLDCAVKTLTLNAQVVGGGNATYAWTAASGGANITMGANTPTPTVSAAGAYIVTVTDLQSGCTATSSVTVQADTQAPDATLLPPNTLTCLRLLDTLQVAALGPNFTYTWAASGGGQFVSGQNTASPVISAAGGYSVTVTNPANGCSSTGSLTVLQNAAVPVLSIQTPALVTCKTTDQTLTAQAVGGGNVNIAWVSASGGGSITAGGNTLTPTISGTGTYTLKTTGPINGCTATASVTVNADTTSPTLNIALPAMLNCTTAVVTLTATAQPAASTYAWSGSGITSGATTPMPTVNAIGTYTVTATHPVTGCTATATVLVSANNTPPTISIAPPAVLTCAIATVVLTATAQPAASTYTWSGSGIVSGSTTSMPTVNAIGIYTVTATHPTTGCTATATVLVSANTTPPTISIAPPAVLTCAIATVVLAATAQPAASTYAWSGSGIVSGSTTPMPTVNAIGTYTVTVTCSDNGCTATATTTVSENKTAPTFSIALPPLLTCTAPVAQLSATVSQPSSQFSAQWTTNGGNIGSGGNTLQPSVNALGVYTLTIQNQQNGCTTTASTTVTENKTAPVCNVTSFPVLTCSPPQVTLVATANAGGAAMTFQWLGPLVVSGGTTLTPSVGASGNYTLIATNQANGCTASTSATVTSDTLRPTVVIAPPGLLTCTTLVLPLDATASSSGPNFTLNWTTTSGNFVSGNTTLSPTVNQPGQYNLLISNLQNGCTRSVSVTVGRDIALPQAEAGPPKLLHCQQLQIQLMGSSTPAAVQYSWAGAGIVSGAATAAPTVDQAGTYTLTVTRTDNGCTDTDEVVVTTLPLPDFEAELKNPTCNSATGQIVFGQITGGQSPYTFSINGGSTFQSNAGFGGLKNGTYALVLRDQFGCTASQSVDLVSGTPPVVQLPTSITLALGDSATLQPITVPPAAGIVQWLWSPAEFLSCTDCPTPVVTPLYSQRYTLTVTDLGGCTGSATIQVLVNRRRDVYAPNVFSPNGDGYNDGFTLYGRGTVLLREVEIFDRWGSLVWRAEGIALGDESLGWNGQVRGQPASPGVFTWKAVVEFVDGEREAFSGDVTVVR